MKLKKLSPLRHGSHSPDFYKMVIFQSLKNAWRLGKVGGPAFGAYLRKAEYQLVKVYYPFMVDAQFYLEANPDVADSGMDPHYHFMLHGAAENRWPSECFDTSFYRSRFMPPAHAEINPLVHFLLHGRKERISPSPFFDYEFYLAANSDIAVSGMDPYLHFVRFGADENRIASDAFDPARYLNENPDVACAACNALEHFVLYGEHGGRTPYHYVDTTLRKRDAAHEKEAIDYEEAIAKLPAAESGEALVEVVVPVYRAKDETLSCLWHVLKAQNKTPFALTVVDDKSPEPELSAALQRLAAAGRFTLLTNERNLGFVRSVNAGMRQAGTRDVVLLNSDTEVYGDWLDRMRIATYSAGDIATATPLTNSGTICSYPHFARDNTMHMEVPYAELDAMARTLNAGETPVTLPTAVGFCMYIRRDALDAVGYFDEEAFGTGYGEENDFCLRAQKAGWRDVLVPNVFVQHLGSASFLGEKAERVKHAIAVIGERYPSYNRDVQDFIRSDPIRPLRAKLDMARIRRCKGDTNILIITHTRGGGTEQHVQEEVKRLSEDDASVFKMRAHAGSRFNVLHSHSAAPDVPNQLPLSIDTDVPKILALWDELGIGEVHVHHIADFGQKGAARIRALLEASGRPWRCVVHDYLSICPRINLADENGFYCGEPDEQGCRKCLVRRKSEFGTSDIAGWRAANHALLAGASEIVVPNEDVSERLARYFPDLSFTVVPHDDAKPPAEPKRRERAEGKPVRVGVIGAISDIKGLPVLIACAEEARRRQLPLQFVVIGYTSDDRRAREAGIEITGPYANDRVQEIIGEAALDAILLTSTVPETHSYTLTIAFQSGLPIIGFDIGAVGQRAQKTEICRTLPLEFGRDPCGLVSEIIEFTKSNAGCP